MSKRIAIGPDQIQHGNKIECHVAGTCATYLDSDLNWQISDRTKRQHLPSPTDATTGRDVWTQRPLTVGVNTYGARDEMVTIRESSSLGKHTEWTITPIDPYSLRRKSQPVDTEYDLGDQVVQATSNNTTRIFTPYTGQERISYEIVAPAGGEILNEDGQINAYRDDFYLFTIAEPTVYDAERKLITDDEGEPVRCYDLRVADMGQDEAGRRLYTVTKVRSGEVPDGCAWVDVEISANLSYRLQSQATKWTNCYNGTNFDALTDRRQGLFWSNGSGSYIYPYVLIVSFFQYNLPALTGLKSSYLKVTTFPLTYAFTSFAIQQTAWNSTLSKSLAWAARLGTTHYSGSHVGTTSEILLCPLNNSLLSAGQNALVFRDNTYDVPNVQPPAPTTTTFRSGILIMDDIDPVLILDYGHTGPSTRAQITGDISSGGVVQLDLDATSDSTAQTIAAALADTTGATDLHLRQVNPDGTPGALIPFQRLGVTNPGTPAAFTYSCKADIPAGVTDFCWCYGDPDYVDFSSTVSGDPENPTETESGEGYWRFSAKLLISSSWRILSRIVKEASWNLLAAITKTSSWSRQATPIEYSSGWKGPIIYGDASKSFKSLKINNYTFKVYSNNKFDFKVSKNFNLGD